MHVGRRTIGLADVLGAVPENDGIEAADSTEWRLTSHLPDPTGNALNAWRRSL
jgi:hypothetical protein